MCVYKRVIFNCKHVALCEEVARCTRGQAYDKGRIANDCTQIMSHGLYNLKVEEPCKKCEKLDQVQMDLKSVLASLKELVGLPWDEVAGDETDGTAEEQPTKTDSATGDPSDWMTRKPLAVP